MLDFSCSRQKWFAAMGSSGSNDRVTGNDDDMKLRFTTGKNRGFGSWLANGREALAEEPKGTTPFETEFFMVQGIGFKCMAWRDGEGKWRTAFENPVLPGNIRIVG